MRRFAPSVAVVALAGVALWSCSCGPGSPPPAPVAVTAGRLADDPGRYAGQPVRVYASQVRPSGPRCWVVRWVTPGRPPVLLRLASGTPTAGGAGYATGTCVGLCSEPRPDLDLPPPFVLVDGCAWSAE